MSRVHAFRPTLLPDLRLLQRDPYRVQIGTDPHRAMVLELTNPNAAGMLDLLDGTRTKAGLLRAAAAQNISADEADRIIGELTAAGLILDAQSIRPAEVADATRRRLEAETAALAYEAQRRGLSPAAVLRRRQAAQVLITGASQLCAPIAATLASSGIGHLDPDLNGTTRLTDAAPGGFLPSDAHRPRGLAAADAVRRAAPDVDLTSLRMRRATFAVLVGFAAPAALTALSYDTRRLAHLAVAVRDGTVVVGPLVRPGQSPCLNCLDLHRHDRDPGWPTIAAQLQTTAEVPEPIAATTALAAAAYAAAEVLAHIDGQAPRTLGATVEISSASDWVRRAWSQHPRCGCRQRLRSPSRGAREGQRD